MSTHNRPSWFCRAACRRVSFVAFAGVGLSAATGAAQPANEAQQVMAAVEKTLQRHAGDVHTCFGRALADRLDAGGKLQLEVTVGPGGKVKEAKVESRSPTVTEGLATCVVEAAKNWRVDDIEPGASVILPLTFSAQTSQFVVNAADAPPRGPKAKGKASAPFAVKILADPENVRARQMAVTHLTVSPANRVAMHRHPQSAKVLYVLKGAMRLLGPAGQAPVKLVEGDAVLIPKGYPHVIENMGRQIPVEMLQVFTPAGPELVYRDPSRPEGRAAFEVLRGPAPKVAEGVKLIVGKRGDQPPISVAGGKGQAHILLGPETGDTPVSLAVVTYQPGAAVAKQVFGASEAFSWVVSGGGVLKVGSEDHPFTAGHALFVPSGQPSSATFTKDEPTHIVQVFAPAGPEQNFKAAAAAPASNKAGAAAPKN